MSYFLGRHPSVFQLCLSKTWVKFCDFTRTIYAVVQWSLLCINTISRDDIYTFLSFMILQFLVALQREVPCRTDWSWILSFKNNQLSKLNLNWFPDLVYPYLVVQLMLLLPQKKQQFPHNSEEKSGRGRINATCKACLYYRHIIRQTFLLDGAWPELFGSMHWL